MSDTITAIATTVTAIIFVIEFWKKFSAPPLSLSLVGKSYFHKEGESFAEVVFELKSSTRIRVDAISSSKKKLSFFSDNSYQKKLTLGYCPDENSGTIPLTLYIKPCPKNGEAIKLTLDIGRISFFNPVYTFYPNDFYDTRIPDQGIWPSSPLT